MNISQMLDKKNTDLQIIPKKVQDTTSITVTLRINFDDHKLFEETTNKFFILEEYFSDVSGSPKY